MLCAYVALLNMQICPRTNMNRNPLRQLGRKPAVEALELRQLMHADPVDYYSLMAYEPPQTAEQWAQLFIRNYESQRGWPQNSLETQLQKFDSQADALAALGTIAADYWQGLFGKELTPETLNSIYDYQIPLMPGVLRQVQFDSIATPMALSADASSSYRANVQVTGVDEQDLIELSDDGYMFVSRGGTIEIFDVSDKNNVEFVHSFATNYSQGMYLTGSRLVSVSTTHVDIFDVSHKTSPHKISTFELANNSWISSSRLVDGQLVVIANGTIQLPPPELIPLNATTSQTPAATSDNSTSELSFGGSGFRRLPDGPLGRFETQGEYLSRVGSLLVASFLPDISITHSHESQSINEMVGELNNLGDWSDLVLGTNQFSHNQITTLVIDIDSELPTLRDSETIHGTHSSLFYADADSVYIVNSSWDWTANSTTVETSNVFRITIANQGADVAADAIGKVPGNIRNARMMDEYAGDLRIVTNAADALGINTTSLFVLRADNNSQFQIVGSLTDIIDNQIVFAAHFDGERAFLTTAEVQNMIPLFDPLHGIDLSDPTRPVEMSELVIPGVATHLQRIDNDHMVSIGYQEIDGNWYRQVSLYNVSDLAHPTLLVNWVSDYEVNPDFQGWNFSPLSIQYDVATGILIVPENQAQTSFVWSPWWGIPATIEPVMIIEPVIARPAFWNPTESRGALVFDIDLNQPSASLNYLGTVLKDAMVQRGYVAGDAIVTVSPDSVAVTSLTNLSDSTITAPPPTTPIPETQFNDLRAEISVVATDDAGNRLTDVRVGDRMWIEIQADNSENNDSGIYQAVVNLEFDRQAFEIVSAPEPLDGFDNRFVSTESDTGFSSLGGFSSSIEPLGPGPQRIVRFQVEVKAAGNFDFVARPSQLASDEFLVYGDDRALRSENITTGLLTLRSQTSQTSGTDVNGDNAINALDALIIVNYINQSGSLRTASLAAESSSRYQLDLNGDGVIGAADVLQIVNQINANIPLTAQVPALKPEGEDLVIHGTGMNQRAVDSVFAQPDESLNWSSWPSSELFFKRHQRTFE